MGGYALLQGFFDSPEEAHCFRSAVAARDLAKWGGLGVLLLLSAAMVVAGADRDR